MAHEMSRASRQHAIRVRLILPRSPAVLHVIALAQYVVVYTRSWWVDKMSSFPRASQRPRRTWLPTTPIWTTRYDQDTIGCALSR